jgi:hypothetical protein
MTTTPDVYVVDPTEGEPLISAARVEEIFRDCLYKDEEMAGVPEGEAPEGVVIVEGIISRFGLHPERLESHRDEVHTMLLNLPEQFQADKGGGWSFLQACDDRNGVQWTGLHQTMGDLFVLGIGLGLAKYLLPREMWSAFPGGMPYLAVEPRP